MSNVYAEVIEALANDRIDYQRISVELAKHNPSLFLRLHRGETKPTKNLLSEKALSEIRNAIHNDQRITAIKALRNATQKTNSPHGLELKEARDIIMVAAGIESIHMAPELQAYVTAIKG